MAKKQKHSKAISGSNWSKRELEEFKVKIKPQTSDDFFGDNNNVNLDYIPPEIRESTDLKSHKLLKYVNLIGGNSINNENIINIFSIELLKLFNFDQEHQLIIPKQNIPLLMHNENTIAETDVCIVDLDMVYFLLQENKTVAGSKNKDPEAQLVAEMIAAFQSNYKNKSNTPNENVLTEYKFPGVLMVGTKPVFYKMTVTKELADSVEKGERPKNETIIYKFDPVYDKQSTYNLGMALKDDRNRILKYIAKFKDFYTETLNQNQEFF